MDPIEVTQNYGIFQNLFKQCFPQLYFIEKPSPNGFV